MHREGSRRVGFWALSLGAGGIALNAGRAVADTEPPPAVVAPLHWGPCGEDLPSAECAVAEVWIDGGGSGLVIELALARVAGATIDAAAPVFIVGSHVDDAAEDVGAWARAAFADDALLGEPGWTYTRPTYDECFIDPVVKYWVDGVLPPEGTVCDAD